ncbi:PIG-L family deacetylase [Glaciihabitans sp. UYNi722]|uniref:PIG-L family deacetylase n=1 Tax=Glaciihabitans sp. UYNi722 TaxID=3156344 RepID=UPI00339A6CA7
MQQNPSDAERVLFVHAHPDDESLATGGTIATLVNRGALVTVVTCTRGELGEVIPADIKHLEGSGEPLVELRTAELTSALAILGVTDHRFLGAEGARWRDQPPRRYTDSGMRWGDSGAEAPLVMSEDALCAAPFGEVAADLATVIDSVKPDAVISYNSTGGYGHPDHVRAHEASLRAAEVMGVPFFAIEPDAAEGQLAVDVSAVLVRKRDALRAHRSQVTVDGDRYFLSSGPGQPITTVERYSRIRPVEATTVAWKDQGLGIHLLAWILALVVGVAVGAIATVDHRYTVTLLGTDLPVGIIATLLIVAALLAGLRIVFADRIVPTIATVGMLGVIAVLSLAGSGGSVLVTNDVVGYLLVYGPVVIAFLVLAWPAAGTFSRDKIGGRPEPKGTPQL